jgi:hypothetical protein
MKKFTFLILGIVSCLMACKKDALKIKEDKEYIQINAREPVSAYENSAIYLTLKPNGKADVLPGGDIVYRASYKIKGKKIKVEIADISLRLTFTIVSPSELHGEHGEVLMLRD